MTFYVQWSTRVVLFLMLLSFAPYDLAFGQETAPPASPEAKACPSAKEAPIEHSDCVFRGEFTAELGTARKVVADESQSRVSETCSDDRSFLTDPTVRVSILIGYDDDRPDPILYDPAEHDLLARFLMQECSGSEPRFKVCGFTPVEAESDDLVTALGKTVVDSHGREHRFIVKIANSSMSNDDNANRDTEAQRKRSDRIEDLFTGAFSNDTGVIYMGHNRVLGGPDFRQVRLDAKLEPHYMSYKHDKPGVKLINRGMAQRSSKFKLMALLGCHTRRDFLKYQKTGLGPDAPAMLAVTANSEINPDDQTMEVTRVLQGMMSDDCGSTPYKVHGTGDILWWLEFVKLPRSLFDVRWYGK